MKIQQIIIQILGKDRNYNYTLEPEEDITSIKDAIDYLEGVKDSVEEDNIPF